MSAERDRGGLLSLRGPEALRDLFDDFEHTAFRLETRESYNSPNEVEPLRKFLAGEPDNLAWFQNWLNRIAAATAEGRRFHRVRVVTRPLSDYSRFGLWCSAHTNAAGEDIRYLDRARAQVIGLPDYDYWARADDGRNGA